jgi:hypothetical protein
MKLSSLRNMALWFAMVNSAAVFADHGNCGHQNDQCGHRRDHCGNHRDHHRCHDRLGPCPTASDIHNFEQPGTAAIHGIINNLNDIFVFQAASRLEPGGGAPEIARINAFIAAQRGTNPGGIRSLEERLNDVLRQLGVPESEIAANTVALDSFITAAIDYSTVIFNTPGDVASQAAAQQDWFDAAAALGNTLSAVADLESGERLALQEQLRQLVINQSQAVLGYNQLPGTPGGAPLTFADAVRDDAEARLNITRVAELVSRELIRQNCNKR